MAFSSAVNIHDVFFPMYIRALENTSHILAKGFSYVTTTGFSEAEVLNWRLASDMNPLSFQAHNICNIARNLIVVILGTSLPSSSSDVDDVSFAQLQARIASTIEILKSATREQFEGRDQATVTVRELGRRMKGIEYVQEFVSPTFSKH
jgi:uncharacterized protein